MALTATGRPKTASICGGLTLWIFIAALLGPFLAAIPAQCQQLEMPWEKAAAANQPASGVTQPAAKGMMLNLRVAFVDMNRVFTSLPETKAAEEQLNSERAKYSKKQDALNEKVKECMAEIETLDASLKKSSSSQSAKKRIEEKRSAKIEEARRLDGENSQFRKAAEETLQKQFSSLRESIVGKILSAVEKIGETNKYDLIFDTSATSSAKTLFLLASQSKADITDEVISAMNSAPRR